MPGTLPRPPVLLAMLAVLVVPILATPAHAQLDADGPIELSLSTENDNLLFGAWAYIAGPTADGTDLGRTYGLSLATAARIDPRLALRFALSSQLYTESRNGRRPFAYRTVSIRFLELNRLTGSFVWRAPRSPLQVRAGLAIELVNQSEVGFGAIGQQQAFHDALADAGAPIWRFEPQTRAAPLVLGVAWIGAAGGRTQLLVAPWMMLRAAGEVGLRLATILAGSAVWTEGRVAMVVGDLRGVRFSLGLQHRMDVWLASEGALLRATIDARLHLGPVAVRLALHRYDGGQNDDYVRYAEPNTTMTFSLSGRL